MVIVVIYLSKRIIKSCLDLLKSDFLTVCFLTFFSFNLPNVNSLECVSMKNQECQIRPEIVNLNTNEPLFYPYSIKINKCKAVVIQINDPYTKICVPGKIKSTNVKVFNLMSRTNETRHIKWHKTTICNNKQSWNKNKCRCECKELIAKGICDKGFIWNPSNCECECDKSYDVGEYLDYKNCKCRKRIIDKLVEECSKNINENETIDIIPLNAILLNAIPLNVYKKVCNSCMVYIVLFLIFLITSNCCVFIYSYWYLKTDDISTKFSAGYLNK